jgi:DNA-3-methyladenine glycosylase II
MAGILHAESEALVALDARFAPLLDEHGPVSLGTRPTVGRRFESLAKSIAYQQLNGRAAATIWGRVSEVVGVPFEPQALLAADPDALRSAGLSGSKARAMTDLARKVADGTVALDRLGRLPDDAVVAELTQVWGIGEWTAHMVLIFDLHRLDVMPTGDYGVQAGWARVTGRGSHPKPAELAEEAEGLRPYRSLAAWYCWRAVDG